MGLSSRSRLSQILLAATLPAAACTSFHEGAARDAGAGDVTLLVIPPRDATVRRDAHDASAGAADAGPKDAAIDSPFAVVSGVPQGESLFAVWGSDPDDVFAVGSNGLHCDYYMASWHCTIDVVGRDYYGVWGTAADDVYAVGTVGADGGMSGVVEHFDGTNWRDVYVAPTPLLGVWGVGDQVLAVGPGGNIYGTSPAMDGAWGSLGTLPANPAVADTAESPVLSAVSGSDVDDFEIAAGLDRIFQYTGSDQFANLDPVPDRTLDFQSVWALPGQSQSAFFGTNYFGVMFLTTTAVPPDASSVANGLFRLFEDQATPGADQLYVWGIWGTATQTLFTADLGRIYTFDVATSAFSPVPSPTDQSLYGVWGSSASDVWIVGENQLILHGSLP